MGKYETTKKAIYEKYGKANVYSIGNCNLQNMLNYEYPFAYSTRVEGWACDYYDVGKGIILCDGYDPIGKKVSFDTMRLFDEKAREILDEFRYDGDGKAKQMLTNLIADFVGTIKGKG